jgi:hypothetical protein
LLFLKYLDGLEQDKAMEAEYEPQASMNEAETRAEYTNQALKSAAGGVVEGSRIRREYPITLGRREGAGKRGKALTATMCWNTALPIEREKMNNSKAFQDYYPEELGHCYGCGRNNEQGHQLKSYWDGDESVASYTPHPYHIAIPGYVYGGLIASLIDCHGTGTAAAAAYRAEGRAMDTLPAHRFVTAALHVEYLRPTPLGVPLEIRGKVVMQSIAFR